MTPAVDEDRRWLAAAASIAARARPLSRPNPAVGALIVRRGQVIGRGWTQAGGRPHAEAVALKQAGDCDGATLYVTLEPCAHQSARGPACADLVAVSRLARVVIGCKDPDPRTSGQGTARLRKAGIAVDVVASTEAETSLEGYLIQRRLGRPHVTLKLAASLDGRIALGSGESRWITGPEARSHVHAIRARSDAILVGGGTLRSDAPQLDVRLPGLAERSPQRWVLTTGEAPDGWRRLPSIEAIGMMTETQYLYVEGGSKTAAAFLAADMVDRLMMYRTPIVIGDGLPAIGDIGLGSLSDAHGRWRLNEHRPLGSDVLEDYSRTRCLPA